MNGIQEELLSMYKDIKTVLDRHGIRYYGYYGTAIGAVRHKGFIPWDNDIDIIVWKEDLPLIEKVLKNELDQNTYYYHDSKYDTHPHLIKRDADFENSLKQKKSVFIDFFPIEKYPRSKVRRFLYTAMTMREEIYIWLMDVIDKRFLYRSLGKLLPVIQKKIEMVVEKDTDMSVLLSPWFFRETFPASLYGEPVQMEFEDTLMPVPEKYDELLTSLFGDYMTPPPEDKRNGARGFPCGAYEDYMTERSK